MDRPPRDDERDWMVAIAGGDQRALGSLYDRYAPVVMGLGMRILGSREDAEDLVHDVFVEVFRKAGDFDPNRGAPRTWLMMTARCRALDRLRRVATREQALRAGREVLTSPAEASPPVAIDYQRLRALLAELPEAQRDVLTLSYFEGLSSQEIAERMQVPIGTVKSRAATARLRLKALFGGGEDTP